MKSTPFLAEEKPKLQAIFSAVKLCLNVLKSPLTSLDIVCPTSRHKTSKLCICSHAGTLAGKSFKAGPWVFGLFVPWYRRRWEESSVKISQKNSKKKLVKCATEVARLRKVAIQSCTQNRPSPNVQFLARKIEFNVFIAWTIFMKLGTRVHHVHGYKTLPPISYKFPALSLSLSLSLSLFVSVIKKITFLIFLA